MRVVVCVAASYATLAATEPPGPLSVKVEAVTVDGSSGREKLAWTGVYAETPVAPAVGACAETVGGGPGPTTAST